MTYTKIKHKKLYRTFYNFQRSLILLSHTRRQKVFHSTENVVFGSNFQSGDFDEFTRFEVF